MIRFTDKRIYLKGIGEAIATNKATGQIEYYSNKFQTGNIATSVNLNEIRAGIGNAVAAIIPTDATVTVDFTAADFSLWAKTAQVGGKLEYNAPVMTSQNITATGTTLTIDVTEGTPVANVGFDEVYCYVQEIGAEAPILQTGTAYEVTPSTGVISGFTATNGKKYKVWYFVNRAAAQIATISTMLDPKVVHFMASVAAYSNEAGSGANQGTRVGTLYIIIPNLKLGANGGVTGDQSANDTTSLSGQALAYDVDTIQEAQEECGGEASALAYYVYVPCAETDAIQGLAIVGGTITVEQEHTAQIPVYYVMADGSLVKPNYNDLAYALASAPTGTTVSTAGVISAGTTNGSCTLTVTYPATGDTLFTCVATVTVVSE